MNKDKFELLKNVYDETKAHIIDKDIVSQITGKEPINEDWVKTNLNTLDESDTNTRLCKQSLIIDIYAVLQQQAQEILEINTEKSKEKNPLNLIYDILFGGGDEKTQTKLLELIGFSPLIYAACFHENTQKTSTQKHQDNINSIYKLWMKTAQSDHGDESDTGEQITICGKKYYKEGSDAPSTGFQYRSTLIMKPKIEAAVSNLGLNQTNVEIADATADADAAAADAAADAAKNIDPTILHTWPSFKISAEQYALFNHLTTPLKTHEPYITVEE